MSETKKTKGGTTKTIAEMNVFQKIHGVMSEASPIAKDGRNAFQKYDYATDAAFMREMRPLITKYRLAVVPQVAHSEHKKTTDKNDKVNDTGLSVIVVKYTIINIDDPSDTTEVMIPSTGADTGDKGVFKALTGARKYFLSQTFMLATGDDPEADEKTDEKAASAPKYGKGSFQSTKSGGFK